MNPARPRVTLAVLNYNGRELLDRVMPAILAQSCEGGVQVLLVDDGSRDGSVRHVRSRWPTVRVLELPENVGVTAAFNRAVASATTELVALLNNDVELESSWLSELVGAIDEHPESAVVTGKLLRFDDRHVIDSAGDLVLWSSAVVGRGHGLRDRGQFERPQPVFAATAGAALYRRSAFELVGPFDERFFAYLEDIDWGFRARLLGLGCRYVPAAVGYHIGAATTGARQGFFGRLQRRNQLLLVAKDFPAGILWRHWPKILVHQLLWLAASVRDRMLGEHLRAWLEFLLMLPRTLVARTAIQRTRTVGARELEAIAAGSVPAQGSRAKRLLFEVAPLAAARRSGARV